MNDLGPNVPEHLDSVLGIQENQQIWSFKESGFWILKYDNQPCDGACTYITVGLGRDLLEQDSGKKIRQELVLTVWGSFAGDSPEKRLASLALDFIERHIPIPNSQVIPWHGGIFEGRNFSALYCTSARHMPEKFEVIEGDPDLIFVWLIPIFPDEQRFCKEHGWKKFEDIIYEQQPDFFDLNRGQITLIL